MELNAKEQQRDDHAMRVTYRLNGMHYAVIYKYIFVLYIHVTVHRNIFLLINQQDALIIQIYSVIKLYMFRASEKIPETRKVL
jgi:hypothetical protein